MANNVTQLPRGGYLVDTGNGSIQFGSPPETIKDTMDSPGGVPQIIVLPSEFFSWTKGISVAEVEFPIYYNFFFKRKRTILVCSEEQYHRFRRVLREAIFGPKRIDVTQDFVPQEGLEIPEIERECKYFSSSFKFSDMVGFGVFRNNKFTIGGVTISIAQNGNFIVTRGNEHIAEVPGKMEYKSFYLRGERLKEPFIPPLFGVTCLGPSHGFDPDENTSGFIIWLNHQGIMIDPPVNSTEWLLDSNVNPKFIDSIILTHCHADHDAGTFQKILEETKITVYATKTVMDSFLNKYSAFTGVSQDYLKQLFTFYPVKINSPVFINGGKFDMFYSLHSIPAVGFKMEFQNQTFVYSSDHNNDPEVHNTLLGKKVLSQKRYDDLRNFPWNSNVIYHESGVAPLHTPINFLNSLSEDIQKRIVVYHIAEKDFPKETKLTLARFGIENTLYFDAKPPEFERATRILSILKHLDFFDNLSITKVTEFIAIVEEEKFSKGEVILRRGSPADKFYVIYFGNISVESEGLTSRKIYGSYDYFGEVGLITGQTRTADVIAETDVVAYTITKDKFLSFISGTQFEQTLRKLAKIRDSETWNILSESKSFQSLTSTQKTWLESLLIPVEVRDPVILLREDTKIQEFYIIRNGEISVEKKGTAFHSLGRGDFVGQVGRIHRSENAEFTYRTKGPVSLYAISGPDILNFLNHNPGLIMKLKYNFHE